MCVCKQNKYLYQNLRLTYTEGFICVDKWDVNFDTDVYYVDKHI